MGKQRDKALRFTHLKLENWRNFQKVDVALQDRAFLVGPNASGKSNLLDAFRFLRDLGQEAGGGLQNAVWQRGGVKGLRCLSARRYPQIGIRVWLAGADGTRYEYEVSFNQNQQRRVRVERERVVKNGEELLVRPDKNDRQDEQRLTQTHLEQVYANKEFREIAEFFRSVNYLHLVPQLVRDPERSAGRTNDPFGGDFLEQIAKTQTPTRKARLNRVRHALRVAIPQLEELEWYRDDTTGTSHLRGRYANWRPHGAWRMEDQFSDGTLRLLGLLWAADAARGPLLLEEPELSLHPEAVRYIPEMLARLQRRSGRQFFVSTHSPELLQSEGIGLDEVLVLQPSQEGTTVTSAANFKQITMLLEEGQSMADAVLPYTRPENVEQLPLFADQ
ncbi:MAG: AAA family ATPase [Planctomycetota bacterium]